MASQFIIILGLFFVQSIQLLPPTEAAPSGAGSSFFSVLLSNDQPSYDLQKCMRQMGELGDAGKAFTSSAKASLQAAHKVIVPLYHKLECPIDGSFFMCALGKMSEIREGVKQLDEQLAEPFTELGTHLKNFYSDLHGCLALNQ